ncbi:MAG: hypothetical protein MUF87_05045 [Anaerolineae bacterium]|jgi:2-phospho-L-lactate guanylyltransferase (CobY/MobA/RfbA family)|nr:hypothetical protein [Anaerolineae bacterium]
MNIWAILHIRQSNDRREQAAALQLLRSNLTTLLHDFQFRQVAVISRDPKILVIARQYVGVKVIHDPRFDDQQPLNFDSACFKGLHDEDTAILLLSGDLPVLQTEIDELLRLGRSDWTIALSPHPIDDETAALLINPATCTDCYFGTGSFNRNFAAAKEAGVIAKIYYTPELSLPDAV